MARAEQEYFKIIRIGWKTLAKRPPDATDSVDSGFFSSQGFILLRSVKHRVRALVPPAIFLAITYYFGWNAIHGKSGLQAQVVQRAELAQAQAQFTKTDAERTQWETRIADLSGQSIAPDMLDSQARQVLNLADPNDLVIDLSPGHGKE